MKIICSPYFAAFALTPHHVSLVLAIAGAVILLVLLVSSVGQALFARERRAREKSGKEMGLRGGRR